MEPQPHAANNLLNSLRADELLTVARLLDSLNNYHRHAYEELTSQQRKQGPFGERSNVNVLVSFGVILLCVLYHTELYLAQLALACMALLYAHTLSLDASDAREVALKSLDSRVNQVDTLVAQLIGEAEKPQLDPGVVVDLERALRSGSLVVSATRATLNAFPKAYDREELRAPFDDEPELQ